MVAAIREIDFRQFTSVALATDRHDLAKFALLKGPASAADTARDAFAPETPSREAVRRRFL